MKKIIFSSLAIIALSMLLITSCVKKDFDAPIDNSSYDPGLVVNSTILNLKKKINVNANNAVRIDSDLVISGIVIADDRSGNYYKKMVIQDGTSAIDISIDLKSLYTDYPIGRKVYIKCKGLYIGHYGKYISLGAEADASGNPSSISSSNIGKHIVKANYPNVITPIKVNIAQLQTVDADANLILLGALIQIDSVQFAGPDRNSEYANASTVNRTLEDCGGNSIIVRSSTYSNFAKSKTPSGRGNFIGIYTRYSSTPQLVMRDTADLTMGGPLCSGDLNYMSIQNVRQMWNDSIKTIPFGTKIKGIVISDKTQGNTDRKNVIIQDGAYGITVRFYIQSSTESQPFEMGDEVEINISGQTISEYNGLLQISGSTAFTSSKGVKVGIGSVSPFVCTIDYINNNLETLESTLVKVNTASISSTSGLTTYATTTSNGSLILNDGSATMTLYTSKLANFITVTYPIIPVSVTGIIGQFNSTKQISIRNTLDVQ